MPAKLNLFEISERDAYPLHIDFFCEEVEEDLEIDLLFDERFHRNRDDDLRGRFTLVFGGGRLCLERIGRGFRRRLQPLLMRDYFPQELLYFLCVIDFASKLFVAHGCVDIGANESSLHRDVIIFALPPSHALDDPEGDEDVLHQHV